MKICYELPRPAKGPEIFHERLLSNWNKVGNPDTELVIKSPKVGTKEFEYSIVGNLYADFLRSIEMSEGIIQAEKEGYDGAVIGCFADPGLDVLQTLVGIPVLAPAKAAIIAGQLLGRKMVFITLPFWEEGIENLIRKNGAENFVLPYRPCRALNLPLKDFADDEILLNSILKLSKEAISDGADVILVACAVSSTFLTSKGVSDVDGVPVVDGALAAIKLVETLVKYKSAGLWRGKKTITGKVMEGLREAYYHGLPSV
jgi:allantoin racemase